MKKLLALLLAFAMVLTLAACTGNPAPTDGPGTAPTDEPTLETEPAVEAYASYDFTQFGKARIDILGAEFIKDDWDEDVLRIYYDYTNTSTSASYQYPTVALDFKSITQNGVEVDKVSFGTDDECAIPEDLNCDSPVQPGLTSRQTMLIKCDPNGGIVEVSCYIMIGNWVYEEDQVKCLTFQIDPKNLPGAPEPLELAPIMNPTYAAGLPTSGTNENGQISIDGMELTVGDAGENVLRVKLTVTNNGDEAMMPMTITNGVEVYQDGFALPWFSNWDLAEATDADDAYEEDLYPGETVQCNALFLLRNDHPVEIVIEDLYSDLRLGMIGDVKAALEAIQAALDAQQQAADAAAAAARKALVGTWLQRDSDWDDTYIFNDDGSGLLISGPEYPFTYTVNGDTLTLIYGPDDEEEFTFSVDGDLLAMIDMWDEELLLDKQAAGPEVEETEAPTEAPQETKATEAETEPEATLADALIGVWGNESYGETYAFNADGTGYQIYEGVTYDYTYTVDDSYVEITYSTGETDAFDVEIYDGQLIIAGYYTYDRQ